MVDREDGFRSIEQIHEYVCKEVEAKLSKILTLAEREDVSARAMIPLLKSSKKPQELNRSYVQKVVNGAYADWVEAQVRQARPAPASQRAPQEGKRTRWVKQLDDAAFERGQSVQEVFADKCGLAAQVRNAVYPRDIELACAWIDEVTLYGWKGAYDAIAQRKGIDKASVYNALSRVRSALRMVAQNGHPCRCEDCALGELIRGPDWRNPTS